MNSQLKWKFVFILLVILVCIFGLIGMPHSPRPSGRSSRISPTAFISDSTCSGGSHLVLQVQVDEAIGQRCDQAFDELTKQLHDKNINLGEISRVDDTHILVRNVDPAHFRHFPRPRHQSIYRLDHVSGGGRDQRLPADA